MAGMDIAPIVRSQDYTFIKHNEDIKPEVDQSHLNIARDQKETRQNTEVVDLSESEWRSDQPDARDKGSNEYAGDGGKDRRRGAGKKSVIEKVVVKGASGGFDFKI